MSIETHVIIAIVISLIISALFSGMEIAFISADKLHVELQKSKGSLPGKIISSFNKKPSLFISTLLVGNTAALVIYGQYMTEALQYLQTYIPNVALLLLVQTIISTLIVLFIAEFLPKSLFMLSPNRMLTIFAIPFRLFYFILYYSVVWFIVVLSRFFIVKVFKWDFSEDKPAFQITDLNNYVKAILTKGESEDEGVEIDTKIFENALEFKTVKVRECMIPRIEIIAVDITDSVDELRREFIRSGNSKILVYKESIDNIIGYCHSLQMFKKPRTIESIVTPIMIVPETQLANELMIEFIEEHKSIALVVDEFGGTSGIVTIEDVIEEIFGEIRDEHDDELLTENKIDDDNYFLSARHEIDYLNDKYDFGLEEGEYDTLGGYILNIYEDIPKINDIIRHGKFVFTIKSMIGTRIDKVSLMINDGD